jgi:radial spoke head protein 4/6
MLEWAGINFGEDINIYLQKSLKRLATMSGASNIKFFGKIYGTQRDYWIAQGKLDFNEEQTSNPMQEARGKGANVYVYWVTDNLFSDWVQLPDVQPEHIQVARMIKVAFTGNLNASIQSCPPFPGKERHLLRAQLARITHATEICPKGLYELDEETQEVKMAEEPPSLSVEEAKSLESWSHQQPILLKNGRCTHKPPVGMPEGEHEDYLAKMAEEDKVEERFRTVNEDNPIPPLEAAWLSKVCGDQQ